MSDDYIWTIAFALMLTALVGVCMPALEYALGGWMWVALPILAIIIIMIALAITGARTSPKTKKGRNDRARN